MTRLFSLLLAVFWCACGHAQPQSAHQRIAVRCIQAGGRTLTVQSRYKQRFAPVFCLSARRGGEPMKLVTTDGREEGWYNLIIYKGDTMKLTLSYPEYNSYRFSIDTLVFKKGEAVIDVVPCLEKYYRGQPPVVLRSFPNDCLGR